jgi:hypothetical protein
MIYSLNYRCDAQQESIIHQFIKQTHSQKTQIKTSNVVHVPLECPKLSDHSPSYALGLPCQPYIIEQLLTNKKNQSGHGKNGNSEI